METLDSVAKLAHNLFHGAAEAHMCTCQNLKAKVDGRDCGFVRLRLALHLIVLN